MISAQDVPDHTISQINKNKHLLIKYQEKTEQYRIPFDYLLLLKLKSQIAKIEMLNITKLPIIYCK